MKDYQSSKNQRDKRYIVNIPIDNISIEGILEIPHNPQGVVLFAHGSGSSRLSPRNNFVAGIIRQAQIATLLFDLLTEDEDLVYENRFNIELLTDRLISATEWIKKQPVTRKLGIGYFGASTGAASALKAAARLGSEIKAVVSRGGRPDLAIDEIEQVSSPTLFIVGGYDSQVIELNRQAFALLKAERKLEIVPGASHLFEEPGTLEKAAKLATDWFGKYLRVIP